MSLLSIFGMARKKPAPLTPAQEHMQFINDTCTFFDLPWDGRKRLSEATAADIDDIKKIRAYSEKIYWENMRYMGSAPMPVSNLFWQHRIEHTALVMSRLHYTNEEIVAHKGAIRRKHTGTHFPWPKN